MSEYEPVEDKKEVIEKAAKLREMIQTAGWKEVIVPELLNGIEQQKEVLVNSDFEDLLSFKLNQDRIKFAREFLDNIDRVIAEADKLQRSEAQKQQRKNNE